MNVHKNARLTAHSRAELVRRVLEGQPRKLVAEAFGVDPKTGTKWVNRYLANGPTQSPTKAPIAAPPNCPSGYTATIGIDPTAA